MSSSIRVAAKRTRKSHPKPAVPVVAVPDAIPDQMRPSALVRTSSRRLSAS